MDVPPPPKEDAPLTGAFATAPAPSSRFVRLTHKQWENTVKDLLGLSTAPGLAKEFLSEPIRSSFDNNGSILQVGNELFQDYQGAAESIGKQVAGSASIQGRFLQGAPTDMNGRARSFIRNFGLRAFRRPLTDDDVNAHLALFNQGGTLVGSGNAFNDGAELVVTAMLQSAYFLYRAELSNNAVNGKVPLSDYEIATRLSYGLTNTMPDEMLFAAAGSKQLSTREQVIGHAERLLKSEGGKATLRDFHEQLMHMKEWAELQRDTKLHPLFKPGMGLDMREEAQALIADVIGKGKGVTELLTAPYSFVNSKLAPLYGVQVPAPSGGQDPFVRVDLDPKQRAGLYTQIGFLATNATDHAPRSIMRGVHLSLDALCVEPPAPPNVPPEAPKDVGKTNRQLLEAFTQAPGSICESCHAALINPLGFALENFDGMGRYRTTEGQAMLPIDARATYNFAEGEKTFNGPVELMKVLAEGRQAHDCYAQHLFEYLFGRERVREGALAAADDGVIKEIGRRSKGKVSIQGMILDMVATDAFLNRLQ